MLPTRNSLQIKKHTQTKRGWKKDIALMNLEGIEITQRKINTI